MAFDFPNPPLTIGQIATGPGGVQWSWDGVKWVPLGQSVANNFANSGRNLLHNGLFNIQQRGAGAFTANNNGVMTYDRWLIGSQSDTCTVSLIALADADRAAIGDEAAIWACQIAVAASATAGAYSLFLQKLELIRRFTGKTVTLSFWARATSGTPRIGIGYFMTYGSGGSPSANITGNYGITPALSTTWQRQSLTFTVPSSAGKTFGTTYGTDFMQMELWLSDQGTYASRSGGVGVQSSTVQLWGMQLEFGIATPVEKLDPQADMANCQRFYTTAYMQTAGTGNAGTGMYNTWYFPVTMRASPTVGWISGPSFSNSSLAFFAANNERSAYTNMAFSATGSSTMTGTVYATADL